MDRRWLESSSTRQVVGADVDLAITLNTVNFENRAHQANSKASWKRWASVNWTRGRSGSARLHAAAAATGVIGSVVTQNTDKQDMNIQDVIRADHSKVNTLFTELLQSNDLKKIQVFRSDLQRSNGIRLKSKSSTQRCLLWWQDTGTVWRASSAEADVGWN